MWCCKYGENRYCERCANKKWCASKHTGLLNSCLGKLCLHPYLVVPLISARLTLISTRVSAHCQAILIFTDTFSLRWDCGRDCLLLSVNDMNSHKSLKLTMPCMIPRIQYRLGMPQLIHRLFSTNHTINDTKQLIGGHFSHYGDIKWTSQHLELLVNGVFVQQFIPTDNKEISYLCVTVLLWGESTGHRWIPLIKGE